MQTLIVQNLWMVPSWWSLNNRYKKDWWTMLDYEEPRKGKTKEGSYNGNVQCLTLWTNVANSLLFLAGRPSNGRGRESRDEQWPIIRMVPVDRNGIFWSVILRYWIWTLLDLFSPICGVQRYWVSLKSLILLHLHLFGNCGSYLFFNG